MTEESVSSRSETFIRNITTFRKTSNISRQKSSYRKAPELIIRNSETDDNCKHGFIGIMYFTSIVGKKTIYLGKEINFNNYL